MGEGKAALSGGLERLSGAGAAVRVGLVGPGRLCAVLKAMQEWAVAWVAAFGFRAATSARAASDRAPAPRFPCAPAPHSPGWPPSSGRRLRPAPPRDHAPAP